MNIIGTLYDTNFSDLKVGHVVYQVQTDVLFIIIGLRGSFPCSESVRDDELDLLSETGKVSNIFHLRANIFNCLIQSFPMNKKELSGISQNRLSSPVTTYVVFLFHVKQSLRDIYIIFKFFEGFRIKIIPRETFQFKTIYFNQVKSQNITN